MDTWVTCTVYHGQTCIAKHGIDRREMMRPVMACMHRVAQQRRARRQRGLIGHAACQREAPKARQALGAMAIRASERQQGGTARSGRGKWSCWECWCAGVLGVL